MPVVHHSYFSVILDGAGEALYEHDMRMVLCPTQHEHDREVSLLERLMQGTTDGALLVLPEESSEELAALHDHGYRFVIVDPLRPLDERVPTVSAAHSSGASEAVEHLLALGHRRIAAITGPRGWIATEERLRGYRGRAGGSRRDARPRARGRIGLPRRGRRRGGRVAARPARAADGDLRLQRHARDRRDAGSAAARAFASPSDLSVVGFDDTFEASIVTPALTTVRQPLAEMGRMAVNLLVRLLQNQRIEALHVELETKLIVRESTAPAAPVL